MTGRSEAALGLACYGAYLLTKRIALRHDGASRAHANAELIARHETRLRIHVEPGLQRHAQSTPRLLAALNAGYVVANVGLTVGWLVRLHRRGDVAFERERRAAVAAFAGALPIFAAFPTAPPRTLDAFSDTLADHGLSLDHPALVRLYNPVAAMPSHHVAFATVTGWGLARRCRAAGPVWRLYPALVAWVVMATGNHFLADVIAGAMLGALARRATR